MAKKSYEVVGAMFGLAKGEIIEAEESDVASSGILGSTLKEVASKGSVEDLDAEDQKTNKEAPQGGSDDDPAGKGLEAVQNGGKVAKPVVQPQA